MMVAGTCAGPDGALQADGPGTTRSQDLAFLLDLGFLNFWAHVPKGYPVASETGVEAYSFLSLELRTRRD